MTALISCPRSAIGRCAGTLTLLSGSDQLPVLAPAPTALAGARFSIPAGGSRKVRLTLSLGTVQLITAAGHGGLAATLVATDHDRAGPGAPSAAGVTLG